MPVQLPKIEPLLVRDSFWYHLGWGLFLLAAGGVSFYGVWSFGDREFSWGLLVICAFPLLFFVDGSRKLLVALKPQPRLQIDAAGVWAKNHRNVAWSELQLYYSAFSGSKGHHQYEFVFVLQTGEEVRVNLSSTDADPAGVRQFIQALPGGSPVPDGGDRS